jgi:hypothetical protein
MLMVGFPFKLNRPGAGTELDELLATGGLGVVLRSGTSGARVTFGSEGTLISGIAGGLGVMFRLGTSGARLVVGTTGSDAACSSGGGPDLVEFKGRGARSGTADISSFISITFQSFLKETIGRPGASETAVGVGSFGLRSFRRKPVAARSSSLRISLPSFIFTSGTFSTSALTSSTGFDSIGFDSAEFSVYAAFLDWVGGFFCIS